MLTYRFDGRDMDREIRKLIGRFEDTTTAHRIIGLTLYDQHVERFQNEEAPDGSKWEDLSPLTLALRRNKRGILRDKGDLFDSIHHTYDASRAEVGTNLNHPKVMVHQHGATILPKRATALKIGGGRGSNRATYLKRAVIPARPYIGIGRGDEEAVREELEAWLGE